jgi:hypothetical protein
LLLTTDPEARFDRVNGLAPAPIHFDMSDQRHRIRRPEEPAPPLE